MCYSPQVVRWYYKLQADREQLLEQFSKMAESGILGEEIRLSQDEYNAFPEGVARFLKVIADYYQQNQKHTEIAEIRVILFQLIVVAYREAKRVDQKIAFSVVDGFIEDYPGVSESCLLLKWCSMANASIAFREVSQTDNKLLVWQQACKLFQAYNEFFDSLLAYLVILWRTAQNKPTKLAIFSAAYADKINQFKDLTGSDDGAFYLIFRLARPNIRNAIAHENIWLDSENGKVMYVAGKPPVKHEIDLVEFMALQAVGSHLGQVYLAAIALIVVMEYGTVEAQSLLPEELIELFNFVPKNRVE